MGMGSGDIPKDWAEDVPQEREEGRPGVTLTLIRAWAALW